MGRYTSLTMMQYSTCVRYNNGNRYDYTKLYAGSFLLSLCKVIRMEPEAELHLSCLLSVSMPLLEVLSKILQMGYLLNGRIIYYNI